MNASAIDGRTSRYSANQKRRLSLGVDVDSAPTIPAPLPLCSDPNERHAYQTMKTLFASRFHNPSNTCDGFGCNVLMYALRYQRYKLFDLLLNDIAMDLNLRWKDRQGNTVLHYAVVYDKDGTKTLEKLIERFHRFGIEIDERNVYGLTPLLLAVFCGRYDVGLTLLTKGDASPFARDHVHLLNIVDYVEIDQERVTQSIRKHPKTRAHSDTNRESVRLRLLLHQVFTARPATSSYTYHHSSKNFFEHYLPQAVHDRSGSSRASILTIFRSSQSSTNLADLIHYINRRHPQVNTSRRRQGTPVTEKLVGQCESSKANVHKIIRLFDPELRPKAMLPKEVMRHRTVSHGKTPVTFKRLGAKVTVLVTLPRPQSNTRMDSLTVPTDTK